MRCTAHYSGGINSPTYKHYQCERQLGHCGLHHYTKQDSVMDRSLIQEFPDSQASFPITPVDDEQYVRSL